MKLTPEKRPRLLLRLVLLATACASAQVQAQTVPNTVAQDTTRKALNVRCGEPAHQTPVRLHCLEENMVVGARAVYGNASKSIVPFREVYKTANASCAAYVASNLYKDNCGKWREVSCHWSHDCNALGGPKTNFTGSDFTETTNILQWTEVPTRAEFTAHAYKEIKHSAFLKLANVNYSIDTNTRLNLAPHVLEKSGITEAAAGATRIVFATATVAGYKINHTASNRLYVSTRHSLTEALCKTTVHDELRQEQVKKTEQIMKGLSDADKPMSERISNPPDTYESKSRRVCGLFVQHAISDMLARFHTYSDMLANAESDLASCTKGKKADLDKCRTDDYKSVRDLWRQTYTDEPQEYCSMAITDAYVECMPKCACKDNDHYKNQSAMLISLSNVFRPAGTTCLNADQYDKVCGVKSKINNNLLGTILVTFGVLGVAGALIFVAIQRSRTLRGGRQQIRRRILTTPTPRTPTPRTPRTPHPTPHPTTHPTPRPIIQH